MRNFIIDDPRTVRYVADSVGSTDTCCHSSIGIEQNGRVVAGVVLDNYSGRNIFVHFSKDKDVFFGKRFFQLVFGYCFFGLEVKRVSAAVDSTNAGAIALGELIGFTLEATLKEAGHKGDLLIFRLLRHQCKFLPPHAITNLVEAASSYPGHD